MKQITTQFIALCAVMMPATSAFSHEGHGFTGSHWHASDVAGFAALGVLIAVAIWLSRK
jgi:Zn-dependent protease with chaperone function